MFILENPAFLNGCSALLGLGSIWLVAHTWQLQKQIKAKLRRRHQDAQQRAREEKARDEGLALQRAKDEALGQWARQWIAQAAFKQEAEANRIASFNASVLAPNPLLGGSNALCHRA